MLELIALPAFNDNYIWCYQNAASQSIVVDPGDAEPVLRAVEAGMCIKAIFITHHHSDHIGGLDVLRERLNVPCYGPRDARIQGLTEIVEHGDVIAIDGFQEFTVWQTPGHTLTHIVYFNSRVLFCGDTLFSLGCGRLFEGSPEQMLSSLDKLASLPDELLVCCTHEYTANNALFAKRVEPENKQLQEYSKVLTELRMQDLPSLPSNIQREKNCNPFLRIDYPESQIGLQQHLGEMPASRLQRFTELRRWKDHF
jgi:hydroxyacylglutathione hydrolase